MVTEKDVQFLENHLSENPASILFARLADAYLQLEKIDEAIKICEDGIKRYPFYATGHYVLGKSYLAKKLYEQAEKEFKRVLLFDPKFLSAHKNYGDLMKEIGWENTCETSYRKILQIDPLDESAREKVREFDLKNTEAVQKDKERTSEIELGDHPEQTAQTANDLELPDEKVDKIDSMPVSAVEDDLLFEQEEEKHDQENDPSIGQEQESLTVDTPEPEEIVPELDKEKEEEFSYLLDDIFKDDVIEEPVNNSNVLVDEKVNGSDITTIDDVEDSSNVVTESSIEADLQHAVTQQKLKQEPIQPVDDEIQEPSLDDVSLPSLGGEAEAGVNTQENFESGQEMTDYPDPFGDLKPPSIESELKKSKKNTLRKKKNNSEKIVTPTLGEIYTAQGQYGKAIDVFETLLKKYPDNEFYLKKIENLKQKLVESKDAES